MALVEGKDYPEHLYYDLDNQIWYEPLGDGTIRAGFTPLAIELAGEVLVFTPTGDDDFHVKVSPDGSSWIEALVVDKDDGTADVKKSLRAQDHYIGTQATGPRLAYVGDSRTVGFGASTPYPSAVTPPTWIGQSFTASNIGVSGLSMKDMARLAYTNLNPLFANEGGMNVAVVWGGYNDKQVDGASAEDTFSYLSAFCRRLRGLGWRVVVCTEISASGFDTFKNTYNGYIRTRWPAFADMIADLNANANIGADNAYSNSTYFQADGVHPKDAGLAIVATIVQAQLTKLVQVGAYTGTWPFHQNYVMFGHAALDHTQVGNYAFIQQNDGSSFFNAPTGKTISFMINAIQKGGLDVDGFTFLAGSAGAPGVCPIGDRNTGMWAPAADTLAWSTGGSERVRITSDGGVGIGTQLGVAAGKGLSIHNPVAGEQVRLRLSNDATSDGTAAGLQILVSTDQSATIEQRQNAALYLATQGLIRVMVSGDGNVGVGAQSFGSSAAKVLAIGNGTPPGSSPADMVQLYAEDVASTSELKVRDEAGNVTTLSPHNFALIAEGPSEEMAWSYYSERDGRRINVDMLKAIRVLERLSGEKLVHTKLAPI